MAFTHIKVQNFNQSINSFCFYLQNELPSNLVSDTSTRVSKYEQCKFPIKYVNRELYYLICNGLNWANRFARIFVTVYEENVKKYVESVCGVNNEACFWLRLIHVRQLLIVHVSNEANCNDP